MRPQVPIWIRQTYTLEGICKPIFITQYPQKCYTINTGKGNWEPTSFPLSEENLHHSQEIKKTHAFIFLLHLPIWRKLSCTWTTQVRIIMDHVKKEIQRISQWILQKEMTDIWKCLLNDLDRDLKESLINPSLTFLVKINSVSLW